MPAFRDLTGDQFGDLTVLWREPNKNDRVYWRCRCSCKKELGVLAASLTTGHTRSCPDCGRKKAGQSNTKHGHARHGNMSREYATYLSMIQRCYNPKSSGFEYYGARGITVCDRWRHGQKGKAGFELFLQDMGAKPHPKLTIERRDVNGNYEPSNCYWVPVEVQARNTRRCHRIPMEDGRILTIAEVAREIGWLDPKLRCRIRSIGRLLRRCEARVSAQTFTRDPRCETPWFLTLRSFRKAIDVIPFDTTNLKPRLTREECRQYFKAVWAAHDVPRV